MQSGIYSNGYLGELMVVMVIIYCFTDLFREDRNPHSSGAKTKVTGNFKQNTTAI